MCDLRKLTSNQLFGRVAYDLATRWIDLDQAPLEIRDTHPDGRARKGVPESLLALAQSQLGFFFLPLQGELLNGILNGALEIGRRRNILDKVILGAVA